VGEPYTVTITTHGLGEGLYLATVVKALNSQGGTAGIVGVGKRIQNVENEHAYTISVTVKEIPDQFLNVQCGFIVSTTGRWEDRTHTAVVKNIRIER
jgi:hypothetical protein